MSMINMEQHDLYHLLPRIKHESKDSQVLHPWATVLCSFRMRWIDIDSIPSSVNYFLKRAVILPNHCTFSSIMSPTLDIPCSTQMNVHIFDVFWNYVYIVQGLCFRVCNVVLLNYSFICLFIWQGQCWLINRNKTVIKPKWAL